MLDVTYARSPLVGEPLGPGMEPPPAPWPGDRYPDRTTLAGAAHHVLLLAAPTIPASTASAAAGAGS
jgi:hypothetical protein